MKKTLLILGIFIALVACENGGKPAQTTMTQKTERKNVVVPAFNSDSAYYFVKKQCDFGPRVPGTVAHQECAKWIVETLKGYSDTVFVQDFKTRIYDGKGIDGKNIIASFNPNAKKRIIVAAHWDSRPYADHDSDEKNWNNPIDGANDGASGVGVLLEVARQLGLRAERGESVPAVDIVFFDCEDMGTPDFYTGQQREDTWCLGSQLWARQVRNTGKTEKNHGYSFGILLDMVGAPDAEFPREYYSEQYAGNRVEEVWRAARQLGYGAMFTDSRSYPVTDDHYYVNTIAGIPCIDIIHYNPRGNTGFAHWWHTHNDNMGNVSPQTLEAVGKTIMMCVVK